ncbi:hypothetical protein Q2941_40840 [Bradyrhizobium sp. UFLA05-153]
MLQAWDEQEQEGEHPKLNGESDSGSAIFGATSHRRCGAGQVPAFQIIDNPMICRGVALDPFMGVMVLGGWACRDAIAFGRLPGREGFRLSAVVHVLDHRVGICRDCPAGAGAPFDPNLFA